MQLAHGRAQVGQSQITAEVLDADGHKAHHSTSARLQPISWKGDQRQNWSPRESTHRNKHLNHNRTGPTATQQTHQSHRSIHRTYTGSTGTHRTYSGQTQGITQGPTGLTKTAGRTAGPRVDPPDPTHRPNPLGWTHWRTHMADPPNR